MTVSYIRSLRLFRGPLFMSECKDLIPIMNRFKLPKFAAMIQSYLMKDFKGGNELSSYIDKYPDFALLAAKTLGRSDYRSWIKQQELWSLFPHDYDFHTNEDEYSQKSQNGFVLIVGPYGEMRRVTRCQPV